MNELLDELALYGADRDRVVDLSGAEASETVRYIDLVRAQRFRPDMVVEEATGRPIAYVVDGRFQDPDDLRRFRHVLALRGEVAFLVIVRPGELLVYPADLGGRSTETRRFEADSPSARSALPGLHLTPDLPPPERAVHELLFELMRVAIDALRGHREDGGEHHLPQTDALSIAGRAVFLRFLIDRGLLPENEWRPIAPDLPGPEAIFDRHGWTVRAFQWLDRTFNGDFLRLDTPYDELATRISTGGRQALGNILARAPNGQLLLPDEGGEIGWQGLDFGRIPVGVLSQVYEHQARTWLPTQAREQSAHYTPVALAELMVREVFSSLDAVPVAPDRPAHTARILDPAVGGGVFLVAAFRALVARRWQADQRRPDTAALRAILYDQLAGFDIEPTALRLTALSLYLAAIEQDPDPTPLESLRFERPLLGTVLFDVGGEDLAGKAGSLGPNAPAHEGQYDVVIGNPPWTTTKRNPRLQSLVLETLRPTVRDRLGDIAADAFAIADDNKDVAFLWRALAWCRPGGRIAQVVHARLLFRQSDGGRQNRDQLLRAFQWTGVLNGAALRFTAVWPEVEAPFAVVFGFNHLPSADDGPYVYSPWLEERLNQRGRLRIDAEAAERLPQALILRKPWLLKCLFRGTRLDVGVLETVKAGRPSLETWWKDELGLSLAQGYQVALTSGRRNARFLLNLPDVTTATVKRQPVGLELDRLPLQRRSELCWPREPRIYLCPLVLVRKSFKVDPRVPSAYLAEGTRHVAFNESFYGFSAHGHADAGLLCRYILLVLSSPLPRWFALVSSSEYGVEREARHVEDLERLPIPRLTDLSAAARAQVEPLAQAYMDTGRFGPEHAAWLCDIYGLDAADWQVITDTLAVGGPERAVTQEAQRPPSPTEVARFVRELATLAVQPVTGVATPTDLPWQVLQVGEAPPTAVPLHELLHLADQHQASRMILPYPSGVLVALLKQLRFWTPTRARLLAIDLLRRMA